MFEVLEGGIQTTVQDFPGRVGYLALGTYPAGPMDHFAFRVANLLVGNSQGTAALEVTVGGLKARFHDRRVLAVTGADMHATLNGRPLPLWESVGVEPGDQLEMKTVKDTGFRAYVAVSGAFDVPDYMGSRATFTVGGFGCNATLVYASTWKVGQLVPGRDSITFKEVTIEEATQRARDLDATISERSIDRG